MTEPATPPLDEETAAAIDPAGAEVKASGYELFALLVSVLSIVNLAIIFWPGLGPMQQVALVVEVCLTPVFLVDFVYRFTTSTDRRRYLVHGYGWADLLAIPPLLSIFRVFRVATTVRRLRRRGVDSVLAELDRNRATTTFFATLFLVIAVVEFAGMAEYVIERDVGNIRTPSDALWWGFVTITTVGYGDQYPVTNAGRIVGTIMLFTGVALFSVLTGFIANAFLAPRPRRRRGKTLHEGTIEADLAHLRALLDEQEEHARAIRHHLDELERKAAGRIAGR